MKRIASLFILFLLTIKFLAFDSQSLNPEIIHVSLNGNDQNDGSASSPVKSLEAARQLARVHAGQRPVEVVLADGIYYMPETFILRPEDSGTAEMPALIQTTVDQARQEAAKLPTWLGMSLRALEGEEFSAFGINQERGLSHN